MPIDRAVRNTAFLGKLDFQLNDSNKLSGSYNFDHSKNTNQTFDVPTYGASANGTEGPSKINVANFNWYTTFSPTVINEAHFTYSREDRPRSATQSNIPADTAMGFGTTFRFGNPFFLAPNVDELFWRTQVRDHISVIRGAHNFKFGAEWIHSFNDQVFRGFFQGRYIFDSVNGFLRYASAPAANGFGPTAEICSNGTWITRGAPFNQTCPVGAGSTPLLLYLQGAGRNGPATDAAGASTITNEDYAVFAQDRWQIRPNFTLNFGLRWEGQVFPKPEVDPSETAYGILLSDPRFPSDGFLPNDLSMWQPRIGFAWDIGKNGKSVLRGSFGIYNARQNMLTQVGSITTNGVQQQTIAAGPFNTVRPVWPNVVPATAGTCSGPLGVNPFPCFSGVRVFSRDYENPDVYTTNFAFEQEIATDWAMYFDFTYSRGRHLTRFLNYARFGYFFPYLDETMVASSIGRSNYHGFTAGLRKRFSNRFQMEANYVLSRDKDDDSNERDPFTDRSFDINDPGADYSLSDRDIRHKFNFFAHVELPWGFEFTPRVQARTAQPATPAIRTIDNRNSLRKDNEYFSFDWRLAKVFRLTESVELTPQIEMFNTFNNDNLINSLSGAGNQNSLTAPSLFNFDGFLRQGIGDPRQVQLAVRLRF